MVMHYNMKFYINILETKPSLAVNIFDTDFEVHFSLPLDYEPPKKVEKKTKVQKKNRGRTSQVAADDDSMMTVKRKPYRFGNVVLGSNFGQSRGDQQEKTNIKKEVEKLQPFIGRSYRLI